MRRYTEYQTIRFSPEELAYLKKCAGSFRFRNGKQNFSAYLRELLLLESGYKKNSHELSQRLGDIRYELRKIGININQVAKKINSNLGTQEDIEELKAAMGEIQKTFDSLGREIEEKWRSQS